MIIQIPHSPSPLTLHREGEKMENISVQPSSLLTSDTLLHLLTESMVVFTIIFSLTFLTNSYRKMHAQQKTDRNSLQ